MKSLQTVELTTMEVGTSAPSESAPAALSTTARAQIVGPAPFVAPAALPWETAAQPQTQNVPPDRKKRKKQLTSSTFQLSYSEYTLVRKAGHIHIFI